MSTVKSAFHSLHDRVVDESIFNIKPLNQNRNLEIRYSKKMTSMMKLFKNFLIKILT